MIFEMFYRTVLLSAAVFLSNLVSLRTENLAVKLGRECSYNKPYDVLVLAIQYAPGWCAFSRCNRYEKLWTIHGLWPSFSDKFGPSACCNGKLDTRGIHSLKPKLSKVWPSVRGSNHERFWEYEWKQHGTCSKYSGFKSQYEFFKTALDFYDLYNPEKWFQNIESGRSYSLSELESEISKHYSKKVKLNCKLAITEEGVLSEIHLCFHPQTLQPIDCVTNHFCTPKVNLVKKRADIQDLVESDDFEEEFFQKINQDLSGNVFMDTVMSEMIKSLDYEYRHHNLE